MLKIVGLESYIHWNRPPVNQTLEWGKIVVLLRMQLTAKVRQVYNGRKQFQGRIDYFSDSAAPVDVP